MRMLLGEQALWIISPHLKHATDKRRALKSLRAALRRQAGAVDAEVNFGEFETPEEKRKAFDDLWEEADRWIEQAKESA